MPLKNATANVNGVSASPQDRSWKQGDNPANNIVKAQAFVLSTHITVEGEITESSMSNTQALMNLIKGTAGTGILSLPYAFKNVGLWAGIALFLSVALVTVHCMLILNSCCEILEKRSSKSILTYVDAVEQSFQYGPKRLQKSAVFIKHITSVSINIMQCSFCCVYIVWIAVNVKEVIESFCQFSSSIWIYEAVVFLILLPYIMIQSLKTLALFSMFANLSYLVGLVIIFQYILKDLPDARHRPAFSTWNTLPLFLGTTMFAFESICLTIPIRSKMQNVCDFGGWNGLLSLGMVIITTVYSSIGFYGFLKLGEETATTITLNLPQNNWLYTSVTILFVVAMFISVGVQFYVPVTLIWPAVEKQISCTKQATIKPFAQYLTRGVLMALIFLVAVGVPHIDLLMSLIGSLFGSFLSLIIPAVIELVTLKVDRKLTITIVSKDVCIILLSLVILITGTYTSLQNIIKTF